MNKRWIGQMEDLKGFSGTRDIIEKYPRERRYTLAMLQDIQKAYNHIPRESLRELSEYLNLPLSKLYSMATFYKDLSLKPGDENIIDENEKCILCGLCVRACDKIGLSAISIVNKGGTKKVSTPYDEPSDVCIGCGACAYVCPVGAINMEDKNGIRTIWNREFELIKCQSCGSYFATREQVEFIRNKLGDGAETILCGECRRKNKAEKLKDIYECYKARVK